jgi:hypothetical protein
MTNYYKDVQSLIFLYGVQEIKSLSQMDPQLLKKISSQVEQSQPEGQSRFQKP